jgi:hypothetical protein
MTRPTAAFLAANLVPDAIGMMPEKPSLHSLPPALAASAPSGAPAVRSRRASLLHNANLRGDLSVATRCGATARPPGGPGGGPAPPVAGGAPRPRGTGYWSRRGACLPTRRLRSRRGWRRVHMRLLQCPEPMP